MAFYVKFEVYLPVNYRDKNGNLHHVNPEEITELGNTISDKFRGLTESNPATAPPFRGQWWTERGIVIDYLMSMFTLVPQDRFQEALAFFTQQKAELEARYFQEFVVVTYSTIQTIGEL